MPSDLIKAGVNLDLLHPGFRDTILTLLANCRAKGKDYLVLEGFRSWARSHQLYGAFLGGGPRAAPAGYSAHNYGLAVDTALILQPSPKRVIGFKDKHFDLLIAEGRALGLAVGLPKDLGHVGMKGFESKAQLEPLKKIWDTTWGSQDDKLKAVWRHVDGT